MTAVQLGVGTADITPPVGTDMCGFAGRGKSTGVHDRLTATVTVAADDGCEAGPRFVLVSLELLVLYQSTTDRIRERIADRYGLSLSGGASAVAVVSTHTHYGPMTMDGFGPAGPELAGYLAMLEERVLEAADTALSNLTPARLRIAHGETSIGINRRERTPTGEIILGQNPGGAIDRELIVVSLESIQGERLGLWTNAACHPVSQGHTITELSGDFPGALRREMSEDLGCPVVFLQGACGNINPRIIEPDFSAAERTGRTIAEEVRALLPRLEPCEGSPVSWRSERIHLPPREADSLEQAEADTSNLRERLRRCIDEKWPSSWRAWLEMQIRFASARLESRRTGIALEPVPCEIQVLRLGDLAVAAPQGELFCEIGRAIKDRSPHAHTIVTTYNGDWIGYIPVASAYKEGGYEVTEASRVGPLAAEILTEKTVEMLHSTTA